MSSSTQATRPPRRFRTRLLLVLLGAGALAVVAGGVVGAIVIDQFLAISLEPVATVLDRVDRRLENSGDAPLGEEVRDAQLYLAQAELARRSLVRLAPLALAGVLAAVLVVLAVIAVRFSRRLSTPIEQLTTGMLRYGDGDLAYRVPEHPDPRGDELQFLLRRFNQMGGDLESQRARLQITEELAAWQDVARALAHELKNPLTAMKMAVERTTRSIVRMAIEPRDAQALRDSMQLLDQQMGVLIRMTRSFSTFARLPRPRPRPFDLTRMIAEVVELYRQSSPVPIEFTPADPVPLVGDPDQLHRALGNLVKNATEAVTEAATEAATGDPANDPVDRADRAVRIDVEHDLEHVQVIVADRGRGIDKPMAGGDLTRSLGSTKPGGSGLGLPIAHKIIHEHRGSLRLEPRPDGGCRAVVTLPRPQSDSTESAGDDA